MRAIIAATIAIGLSPAYAQQPSTQGPPLEQYIHSLSEDRSTNLVIVYHGNGTLDMVTCEAGQERFGAWGSGGNPGLYMRQSLKGLCNHGTWWMAGPGRFCFMLAEGPHAGEKVVQEWKADRQGIARWPPHH